LIQSAGIQQLHKVIKLRDLEKCKRHQLVFHATSFNAGACFGWRWSYTKPKGAPKKQNETTKTLLQRGSRKPRWNPGKLRRL
jgi:hypothetical protein